MSDTSFDSDAYAEGSSTEVGSEPSLGGEAAGDEDSAAERRKRNKTLVKATLNHNSIWASSVDVLDREERCVGSPPTSALREANCPGCCSSASCTFDRRAWHSAVCSAAR